MDIRLLYVFLVLVAFSGGYLFFRKWQGQRARDKQIGVFREKHEGVALELYQQRALTSGAILSCSLGENILSFIPTERPDIYKRGLLQQWGISDRVSAEEVLVDFIQLKKSKAFDEFIHTHWNHKEVRKIYKKISEELNLPEDYVNSIRSTYAWDVARIVGVSKWSYWVGYVDEEKLLDCFKDSARLLDQLGHDWTSYTCSFLLGRCIQGYDMKGVLVAAQQLLNPDAEFMQRVPDAGVYTKIPIKESVFQPQTQPVSMG